ncbi:MAG TPA: molybdopterin cofactor-binding domain-containing protein, partial [Candidatus Limnocylindria bacterium]|nr:molybdopterin cofactor-binding domain-containing protein [Candidatus Limnocylindria bacterium]
MSIKVIRTKAEFEGQISEETALVEGKDVAPWSSDDELGIVGTGAKRVDGIARVTGRARYTQDLYLPGMLHVRMLRSPYPRARVRRVDASRAQVLPGVRGVLHRFNAPMTPFRGEDTIFREEVRFAGDEVAAVAADTEEIAAEAVRLIDVEYEVLPFVPDLEEAMRDEAVRLDEKGNVTESGTYERGDAKRALVESTTVVEATYRTSTQLHNSLETHGAVARWDGDELTVWESTQHVFGVRAGLQAALKIPFRDIR